jgi:hypothetical protein
MHYFLYPTKDAFISNDPDLMFKNMGRDEILEVEKQTTPIKTYSTGSSGSIYPQAEVSFGSENTILSRALLQFNLTDISRSIALGTIIDPKFYLTLKTAQAWEVPVSYTLAAYPLAVNWSMGTGYRYDGSSIADGVSWKFADGVTQTWWTPESLIDNSGGGIWYVSASLFGSGSGYAQPPFASPTPYDPFPYCSGSAPATSSTPIAPVTGGFVCSQSFDYQSSDVRMNVTTIVNAWLSNTIPNNGLILLHSGESDSIDYGKLRFFSKETNTIYSPHLDIAWDDSTFVTGSGTSSFADPLDIQDAVVNMKNMSAEYKVGSIIKFSVTGRKRYPVKTFTNRLSDYLDPYYLPYDSFYSVKDAESADTVIPVDLYTRLSFNSTGNYFFLDTTGLPQERYFKISIKTEQSGSIRTFDIPTTFKITR